MNETEQSAWLLDVMERGLASTNASDLLESVVSELRLMAGASAVAVIAQSSDGPIISHHGGIEVPAFAVDTREGLSRQTLIAPSTWQRAGIVSIFAQPLPGRLGTLVFGWTGNDPWAEESTGHRLPFRTLLVLVANIVGTLSRIESDSALADLARRVEGAQHLAGMGDYDWHIVSDTNTWSDQLYRIYGYEPQSFNASYDRFLESIHPDDRERIQGVHQQAYATGEPYAMIERIVRPNGEVRYLSSNGEVIHDAHGSPVRMRGTCIDITEQTLAELEREQVSARFHGLVDKSPDAILVADEAGHIVQANPQAAALLGADPVGYDINRLLTDKVTTGAGQPATGLDGRELLLDITKVALSETDPQARTALFLLDAAPRIEREATAQRLNESRQRRRQAFEINDNVIQGLTAASHALEQTALDAVRDYLNKTIESARAMMGDLLEPSGESLVAGDLVRSTAATLETSPLGGEVDRPTAEADPEIETAASCTRPRVLIVDDSEDLRKLLRLQLERLGTFDIVGEAVDGIDAVELARTLQPDLVLLDMAMPRMDGLQALPLIREAVPQVRVVVLSGFNQATLEKEALAAGTHRYVTKGGKADDLLRVITSVLDAA